MLFNLIFIIGNLSLFENSTTTSERRLTSTIFSSRKDKFENLLQDKLFIMSSSLELSEIVIDNGEIVRPSLLSQEHGATPGRLKFGSHGIRIQRSLCCRKVLDPNELFLHRLNKVFLISCVLALAWDPLFFYVPVMSGDKKCLSLDKNLAIIAGAFRTFTDLFYLLHIILKFHTGFVAPPQVFGGPQIVLDQGAIARRYLSSYFIVDILAVLPLPQMAVYVLIPNLSGKHLTAEGLLMLVIFTQYVPRVIRIYPLYEEVKRSSGLVTDSIWAGAAYNLFLYMLASHVIGSVWYLFAVYQQSGCWAKSCLGQGCYQLSLYCKDRHGVDYAFNSSYCTLVDPSQITDSAAFNSGLYFDALRSEMVQSTQILRKLSYCFWWGLRNLSSCGQNLDTSTYFGENVFATLICVGGLILFALLIGNMQKYLQMLLSADGKEKEVRHRRQVMEQWMSRRLLPEDMRERIWRYEEYKWKETRGVDEESIMLDLPREIRMDIKRYLGLASVMRVPLFEIMEESLKNTMCDRLKPVLYTKDCYIVRQGDPVNEFHFITRGELLSFTTDNIYPGFFNSIRLIGGDFCGDELISWALDPYSSSNLPISTSTVKSETEVVAFALLPDDLKFVASEFRRQNFNLVRHIFRYYSLQWRTWAACFIQSTWRKYCSRMHEKAFQTAGECTLAKEGKSSASLGATIYASRFIINALRSLKRNRDNNPYARVPQHSRLPPQTLQKPREPNFTSEVG